MKNRFLKLLADNRGLSGRRFEVRKISGAAAQRETEVFLYDAIVDDELEAEWWGGVAPAPFVKELREIDADVIHLRINSPGGSVFAARTIEQALREHPARVVAHVDGLAASAATVVAMAADEVLMGAGSMFMIHKAWTIAFGNAADLLDTATLLEKIDGTLAATYAARTGGDVEQIAAWMKAETWFTADEAVQHGFADAVATGVQGSAAWNLAALGKPPAAQPPAPSTAVAADAAALIRNLNARLASVSAAPTA